VPVVSERRKVVSPVGHNIFWVANKSLISRINRYKLFHL
jgi:hypothetical protein